MLLIFNAKMGLILVKKEVMEETKKSIYPLLALVWFLLDSREDMVGSSTKSLLSGEILTDYEFLEYFNLNILFSYDF